MTPSSLPGFCPSWSPCFRSLGCWWLCNSTAKQEEMKRDWSSWSARENKATTATTTHNTHNNNNNNNRTPMFWLNYVTRKCGLLLVGKCSLCHGNLAGWNLIIHPFLLKEFWWFNSQVKRTFLQLRIISVVLRKNKTLWPWFWHWNAFHVVTLQGTNIYPIISPDKVNFEYDFPFSKVGYVTSLELHFDTAAFSLVTLVWIPGR